MISHQPQSIIRREQSHLREHLFCAALLAFAMIGVIVLLKFVWSTHFVSRSALISTLMDTSARVYLLLMIAACLIWTIIHLLSALMEKREIQFNSWAALSLHQQD